MTKNWLRVRLSGVQIPRVGSGPKSAVRSTISDVSLDSCRLRSSRKYVRAVVFRLTSRKIRFDEIASLRKAAYENSGYSSAGAGHTLARALRREVACDAAT